MSLAMPTVRVVRFRQAQNQSEMKIKRLDKSQCEDEMMSLSLTGILKDAVCVIYGSLQKWREKRRLASAGSKVKANRSCSKVKPSVELSSDSTPTGTNRGHSHVQRRLASKPIPIPTRDRHGQRYPVYERKQFLHI